MCAETTVAERTPITALAPAPERASIRIERLSYTTERAPGFTDITDDVRAVLGRSGVRNGFVVVFSRTPLRRSGSTRRSRCSSKTWNACSRGSRPRASTTGTTT